MTSFLNFTDRFEADAVRECTSGSISSEVDCRFQNTVVPLKSVLPKLAKFTLSLLKPFFALREISCGMNAMHPEFWAKYKNPNLTNSTYELLIPINNRVLEAISELPGSEKRRHTKSSN